MDYRCSQWSKFWMLHVPTATNSHKLPWVTVVGTSNLTKMHTCFNWNLKWTVNWPDRDSHCFSNVLSYLNYHYMSSQSLTQVLNTIARFVQSTWVELEPNDSENDNCKQHQQPDLKQWCHCLDDRFEHHLQTCTSNMQHFQTDSTHRFGLVWFGLVWFGMYSC